MSILDIYTATNEHQEVLQAIENRIPNEMGDANIFDWLKKITELGQKKTSQSYINYYTGEQAEIESMDDKLKELGYENVSQFESRTHPDNDLRAINSEGNEEHFSVKSHKSTDSFEKTVTEHPDSKNYIVNSEVYQDMENSGQLMDYESRGIHIIDGGFSHAEHVQEAEVAFEDIEEAVDVSDDIPMIALASLSYKTFNNVIDFAKGKQSKKELGLNVAVDTAGVGGRAVGALGGAKIGATVGSTAGPVGTLVGGIGGAIVGSKVTSEIIKDVKEKWKWSRIIDAIDYYGRIYYPIFLKKRSFRKRISKRICDKIYNCSPVIKNLKIEKKIYKNNSHLLSRLCLSPRSIKETLILEYMKSLKKYLSNTESAVVKSFKDFQKILKAKKRKLPKEEKDIRIKRYIGEFVIENKELFIKVPSKQEVELLKGYQLQKKECPNHPYKISNDSNKYFTQLLWKNLMKVSA